MTPCYVAKTIILPVGPSYAMYPSVLHTEAGVGSRRQSSPKMDEDGHGAQVPYG